MKTGDIILVPFPFAELSNRKVRPCVAVCETKDKYRDVVVSAISSVVPKELNENEILLEADFINNLRVTSVIKVDRIVTVKKANSFLSVRCPCSSVGRVRSWTIFFASLTPVREAFPLEEE
jgi:mRNA interferase MazF